MLFEFNLKQYKTLVHSLLMIIVLSRARPLEQDTAELVSLQYIVPKLNMWSYNVMYNKQLKLFWF